MSKKSQSVEKHDDFADDFNYENSSQPYAGQRVADNNLMNNRRSNRGRGGDGEEYPMVVLPSSKRYGSSQNNDYDDVDEDEEEEQAIYRRKRRVYRTVKIFSVILLALALLGFFVPVYLSPLSGDMLVIGSSLINSTGSPFEVFMSTLSDFPTALLTKTTFYSWWLAFCLVAMLICTIATLATKKACVVWFSFECIFAIAAVFGYFLFITPTQILIVDFLVIAAVIAVIAFIAQAFAIGKSGAVLPMLSLIAMIFVVVYTRNDSIIAVKDAVKTFVYYFIKGTALPADFYQLLAYIAVIVLLVNIVLTVLQLCSVRHTTWFSFLRYLVMAGLTVVALVLTTAATGKSVFGLVYLPVFALVSILLALLSFIACLHNRKIKARAKEPEAPVEEAPVEEEVHTAPEPAPVAPAPAPVAYAPVAGLPNIFINVNSQGGGNAFTHPVPIMQYAADPYTTKKIYSDGFVGTVNRVPHDIDENTGIRKDEYNLPFDYMGESCANEKATTQSLLPDRQAPELSAEELKAVMANSSLDTILPAPELPNEGESNIEYIAETGTAPAQEEAIEAISEEPAQESVAEEVTEEATEEVTEEATEEATEEVTEEATEEVAEEVTEEVTEEAAEEVTEEVIEETESIEKIEEPVPEEVIDEDAEAEETEEVAEEVPAEEEEEEVIEDDAFLQSLTKQDRKEFRAVFLGENTFDYLPAYDIGGDNSLFFNSIFIYLSKIRENISDSLLAAIYAYLNS